MELSSLGVSGAPGMEPSSLGVSAPGTEPSSLGVSGAPGMETSSLGVDKLVALTYSESHISHHRPLPEPSHQPVEHSVPGGAHANYTFLISCSRRSLGHGFANFVNGCMEYMTSFLLMVAEDISPA